MSIKNLAFTAIISSYICTTSSAVTVAVGTNTQTINEIVVTIDGSAAPTTFTNTQTGAANAISTAELESVTINGGTVLNNFSRYDAVVTNFSAALTTGVIEVLNSNSDPAAATLPATGATPAFLAELGELHSNGDIANYIRVDGGVSDTAVWDVQFNNVGFDDSDYLIVEERDGNTDFSLTALDINGNIIAGATLDFDGGSYDFDTGLSNVNDPFNDQSQVVSVIDLSLFNTTTAIGGFQVNDTGNADIKVFIGSTVPEPSSILLVGLSGMGLILRRRR